MIPLNDLVESYIPRMEEYLQNLATIPESTHPIAGIDIPLYAISDFVEKLAKEVAPQRQRIYDTANQIVKEESLDFHMEDLDAIFHVVDVLDAEEKQVGFQSKPKRSIASFFH